MKIKQILSMVFMMLLVVGSLPALIAAPPTSQDNIITANEDTARVLVEADFNFSDTDAGETLSAVRITQLPLRGSLTLNGNAVSANTQVAKADLPNLAFTPRSNENGVAYDRFFFKVIDDASTPEESVEYRMGVNVNAVNDAPTAVADTASTSQNTAVNINVLANDNDLDGDTLTFTITTNAVSGTTAVSNGVAVYTPNTGFSGTDTFEYTANDGNGGTDSALVTVTVNAPTTSTLGVSPSTVAFNDAQKATVLTVPVTISNTGNSATITGVTAVLENVDARFQASVTGTIPTTLAASATATFNVQLTIPANEDSVSKKIGTLKVTGTDGTNTLDQTVDVTISPKTFLNIDRIEINGETSGKLSVEEDNEIEVRVKNTLTVDIDNVDVTVTIIDVDGSDLDEHEEIDLRDGETETLTFTFDLSDEKAEEDSYIIEVVVEGTDDNGATHKTTERKTVSVDRESHQVLIRRATLSRSSISCTESTSLMLTIENVGKNDENDVEVRVSNGALNLDIRKGSIDLDDFKGRDNLYRLNLPLELQDPRLGSHDIRVEVLFDDGDEKNSEELTLEVRDCGTTNTQVVNNNDLVNELQQGLEARRTTNNTSGSLRDGQSYLVLLGILAVLAFVAVVLALAVLFFKKK